MPKRWKGTQKYGSPISSTVLWITKLFSYTLWTFQQFAGIKINHPNFHVIRMLCCQSEVEIVEPD